MMMAARIFLIAMKRSSLHRQIKIAVTIAKTQVTAIMRLINIVLTHL